MTDDRNYLDEALQIVAGATSKLPEKAHLVALDRQLQAMNRNIITLGELLLCILDDNRVPAMEIPVAVLEKIRRSRTMPFIHHQPTGAIVVKVVPMGGGPIATQPSEVM